MPSGADPAPGVHWSIEICNILWVCGLQVLNSL